MGVRLNNLVENAFERFANNAFVINQVKGFSYSEVSNDTTSICRHISSLNILAETNVPIAILCDNKSDSLVSLLTSLILEKAYIPLDNLAPINRNFDILLDNKIPYLIISKSYLKLHEDLLSTCFPNHKKVEIPEINAFLLVLNVEDEMALPQDIAYILFTSGSTGKPKGIQISHTNALSFILWAKGLMALDEHTVFSSIAPFQFDLSVFDIYVSILSGARLLLFENDDVRNPRLVAQLIDEFQVNVLYTTPTVYRLLWSFGKVNKRIFESVQIMIFAGEVMSYQLLELMKEKCPDAQYYNFYGPTETNVCTYYEATEHNSLNHRNVPIGECTSFAKYKIRHSDNDAVGELLIAGDSVFSGYLLNDKMTEACLISDETGSWYATGDLVKEDAFGQLHYIDRSDRMVKVKGYRIELNEIESVISKISGVSKTAVVTKKVNDEIHIIAYLEIEDSTADFNVSSVKEYCSYFLPHYMIPNAVSLLEKIPINNNSKVDYNLLSQW